jgi:molybdopterin molybdotransferase
MLTVPEARRLILDLVSIGAPLEAPLADAVGLCPIADVVARNAVPRFDNSSMDGYAVRRADLAPGRRLSLRGEVRAGAPPGARLGEGEAYRIMTGAELPLGADSVLPIEVARESDGYVQIEELPDASFVRRRGEDISPGDVLVEAGHDLGAGELGLLAAAGMDRVTVRAKPRVAWITTGDELVAPDDFPAPGQIRDSNAVALDVLIREAGGIPTGFPRVADDPDAVERVLKEAAAGADLVVSAGGVSVGRHDCVREVVESRGDVSMWRVAMQPGKPVLAGRVHGAPFVGLPGNPVSVHVAFEQFVRPALRKWLGARALLRPVVRATLTERLEKASGRLHFVRVRLGVDESGISATPTGAQGSHIQSSLVDCHGVARFDIEQTLLEAGEMVPVEVWQLPHCSVD